MECRVVFHGRRESLNLINEFMQNRYRNVRAEYKEMEHWNKLPELASTIKEDHLFVVVTARKGTVSYKNALERLPDEINNYFSGKTIMIIFPDQFGEAIDTMTFAQPQHTEERSAYDIFKGLFKKKN